MRRVNVEPLAALARSLALGLALPLLAVGCDGSPVDDCAGACTQGASCAGSGDESACSRYCADFSQQASSLGCTGQFDTWAACAAGTNQCSAGATVACITESSALGACINPGMSEPWAPTFPGNSTDACLEHCEATIEGECAEHEDCATSCASHTPCTAVTDNLRVPTTCGG